jgi:hypothetical protein
MWTFIKELLWRGWKEALANGSSTGISVFWLGFGVLALGFVFTTGIEWLTGGSSMLALRAALKSWKSWLGAALALIVAWTILFAYSLFSVVYTDHKALTAAESKTCPSEVKHEEAIPPSLKQRTLLLANKIQEFSEETYPSGLVGEANSGLKEEDRQEQQKKYDGEIAAQFQKKFYKEIRQIIREFKAKGIYASPTESLLSQQPKETRVGPWFVELIKDLRLLASEIDDSGKLIQ